MHSQPLVAPSYPNDPHAHDPYGAPLQGRPFAGQPFEGHGEPPGFQPAYDPAIYGTPPPQPPSGYPSQAYYEDPSRMPHADEAQDEDFGEERPRRGMKMMMVLAGLAILGTGAAFGYRALFGSSGSNTSPPVIKANTSPSKVAAAPAGDSSNKIIYDRVGDPNRAEKVVSREEQPVDVKDTSRAPPRVVFPGMPGSPNAQDSAMAMASPPLGADPIGPGSAEPKKVRTVTIRPDQPMPGAPAAPARANNAAPSRAAAAPAAPSMAFPPPSPQRAAPAPAQSNNAPLSLSPQVASAEPPSARPSPFPPPVASAPSAPARVAALPPAADVASGAYTVQISSQRSEAEAQASFRSLQAKFPSILGDRQPIIRRADLGDKGIYFRAMVGPFASADQATQFCGNLKSAGGQCVVQRN
jgi:hypothetical protein